MLFTYILHLNIKLLFFRKKPYTIFLGSFFDSSIELKSKKSFLLSVPRNQYKGLNLRDLAKWEQLEKGLFKHLPRTWLVFFFRQKASFFFSRQVVGGMKLLNYSLLYVRNFKPNTIGPRSFIYNVWELLKCIMNIRCMRVMCKMYENCYTPRTL